MFNKFKDGEIVIINGIGKCNNTIYVNVVGRVICRDPYFLDYNVLLEDGTEDWFDGKYLIKVYKDKYLLDYEVLYEKKDRSGKNENNIHKNKRI